jgi:hypothetical protein
MMVQETRSTQSLILFRSATIQFLQHGKNNGTKGNVSNKFWNLKLVHVHEGHEKISSIIDDFKDFLRIELRFS